MEFYRGISAIEIEPRRCSPAGWRACQQLKWGPEGADTHSLDGIYGDMSAIEMEPRRGIATHTLDGNFMGAYQQLKWSTGDADTHILDEDISAIEMGPRRCTATHSLDGIS